MTSQPTINQQQNSIPAVTSEPVLINDVSLHVNLRRVTILAIVILVISVVIGTGSYYGYNFFLKIKKSAFVGSAGQNSNMVVGVKQVVNVNDDSRPVPQPDPDFDNDGLADKFESIYGTDPQKPDTDGDGLIDIQEITVTHTDPLRSDTDFDGYNDGEEIKNGYNPNGPGKMSANNALLKK